MADIRGALVFALAAVLSGPAMALKDPTRPLDPGTYFGTGNRTSATGWSLQSIIYAPDRRIAVINGRRVQEGERVGAAKVLRISDSHVLLNTGNGTLTLRLLPKKTRIRP